MRVALIIAWVIKGSDKNNEANIQQTAGSTVAITSDYTKAVLRSTASPVKRDNSKNHSDNISIKCD